MALRNMRPEYTVVRKRSVSPLDADGADTAGMRSVPTSAPQRQRRRFRHGPLKLERPSRTSLNFNLAAVPALLWRQLPRQRPHRRT
uniref:Uncharacterized protein n=1 Tax=Trichuris muris TaxID=70415 RepID=A0A5S6QPB8_TRIMR